MTDERTARLELIALLYQDPLEWVAEGEARALADWAEENDAARASRGPGEDPGAVSCLPDPLYLESFRWPLEVILVDAMIKAWRALHRSLVHIFLTVRDVIAGVR